MTIEALTDIVHEYMYDRLNVSSISNDGREAQHIQERQCKRKWSEKFSNENLKKPE